MTNSISDAAWIAYRNNQVMCKGNTCVTKLYNKTLLLLHGHCIAMKDQQGNQSFSMCGYPTVTTRDRLKCAGITIVQRQFKQYYLHPLTNDLTEINEDDIYEIDSETKDIMRVAHYAN